MRRIGRDMVAGCSAGCEIRRKISEVGDVFCRLDGAHGRSR